MRNFVEPIENPTALDGVCGAVSGGTARMTGSRAVQNALSGTCLRRPLHPALSGVPIGAWVGASPVDRSAGAAGARTVRFRVGTGVVAAAPTVAAGAARPHALSATCTHAGGPLDEGKLAACLRCPWRGSVFRLGDGEVERGAASAAEPVRDVKTEGGRVHVRAGGGG